MEEVKKIPATNSGETETVKSFAKRKSIMAMLDITEMISADTIIRQLPFILFIAGLAILYIANAHYAEKTTKSIYEIDKDLKELRWNFMATESELQNLSKQSQVAKMVDPQGLKELATPPIKIQWHEQQH